MRNGERLCGLRHQLAVTIGPARELSALEHDGGGNRFETVAALSIVLPRLPDGGFRFRTP